MSSADTKAVAERFASYASSLAYDDLPSEVIARAKTLVIDTIGCAFGGYDSHTAAIARDIASLTVARSCPATVLGSGHKTSVELAAFANDVMARYLDFNDGYFSKGGGHASDSIPALLAAAEGANSTGKELIVSIVLAYEIYCRISDAWDNKINGIDHSTVGGIASVLGVSRLLGLSESQIAEALNIMIASNISIGATRLGKLSQWKNCAYANANRNAVFAAQLAQRGMTGPSPIFEGRRGFFEVVSREQLHIGPLGGNGEPFRIMQCHIKQFPLGNFSQSVVTALLEARKSIGSIDQIVRVDIAVSEKAISIMADGPEKWRPQNRETADHSIPFTAAVALKYGTVHHDHFADEYLKDPELLDIVSRVRCIPSEEATRRSSELNLCEIEVTLKSGESKSIRTEYHRGHPKNPMTDSEIEAKFRGLTAHLLGEKQIQHLLAALRSIETTNDVPSIMELTQIHAGSL